MAEGRPRIDLFCEDRAHEQFVRALLERLAGELGLKPIVQVVSARGGHARALAEFALWQTSFLGRDRQGLPDLLVLVIDANCNGWHEMRRRLEGAVDPSIVPRSAVGCPDPHVERWYIADPAGFERVVGARPAKDREKCERGVYKRMVEEAAERADLPLLTGAADLAPDLVMEMDLFHAGKDQPSLRNFVDTLSSMLKLVATGSPGAGQPAMTR